jgi:hypothetical protein
MITRQSQGFGRQTERSVVVVCLTPIGRSLRESE